MLSAGDVFCYYIRDLNKYGACQILKIVKKDIYYVVLDNLKDTPLNQDDLKNIKPLSRGEENRYFQNYVTFSTIPHSYIYVGNTANVITQLIESHSNQWPTGLEYILLKEWSEIPREESEAYIKHQCRGIPVIIGTKTFMKNEIYLSDEILAEISDYSDLDILPCLSEINIDKYYDGLFSYLQTRHCITNFYMWNCNRSCLDLRETLFTQVILNISGIHTLYLNDRIRKLILCGNAEPDLKIYAKNNGAGIYLIYSVKNNALSNFGLREIEDVALTDIYEIDANQVIDQFTELRKLRLNGNPGCVLNLGKLSRIQSLEELHINDLIGFSTEDLTPLLGLENLNLFRMGGVPEEAGNYARKAFKQFAKTHSYQWSTGLEYTFLKEWSEIPREESEAHSRYRFDRSPVIIGTKTFMKNERYLNDDILTEISDYSELDILPCLSDVQVSKHYEGLLPYLQTRNYIHSLNMLNYNRGCLDLRETLLTHVRLNISGIHTLYLNDRTRRLTIFGKAEPDLMIYAKNNGAGIYLNYSVKNNVLSNFGLREIDDVVLWDIYEIDANQVADQFTELKKLFLSGNPGCVLNLGKLSKILSLEELQIHDLFGFSSEDLAPLLGLENLNLFWMTGVPEEAGKFARKAFKGKVNDVDITKLRKPEWIIENAKNPFRSWDGDEGIPAGVFKKASTIYKNMQTELIAAAEKRDVLLAVTKYAEAFNKLDKKYENFIETTQAEDIFNALEGLFDEIIAGKEMMDKDEVLLALDEKRAW